MVAHPSGSFASASAMIRMSDVSSALEGFKGGREDSSSSLSSWTTTFPTPPIVTGYVSSSSSGSSSSSATTSPFGDVHGVGSSTGQRSVRFADECGGELVSDVRTTANWWEEMVLGVDRCEACGQKQNQQTKPTPSEEGEEEEEEEHAASGGSVVPEAPRTAAQVQAQTPTCHKCGVLRQEGSPSELFRFIEELSRGVEATLAFPSLVGKKRRSVILYTEDNGESLCWMTTGGKPGQPYQLPCKTLLEVKVKLGGWGGGRAGAAGEQRLPASQAAVGAVSREGSGLRRAWRDVGKGTRDPLGKPGRRNGFGGGASFSSSSSMSSTSSSSDEEEEEGGVEAGGAGEEGGSGGDFEVRIKLTWRLKPTWSSQKVTIESVRCSSPAVFSRGMAQLRSHNMDLQER